ncbi:MAG TPA: nuclear transport factor 2 family protein [Chitinophagaceae bacterium]|nr:nuclear transport factor 2 family protein [Chitinophagaceae bacterium]
MIKMGKTSLTLLALMLFYQGFSQTDKLYATVIKLDSTFFSAYNSCDINKQAEFYSDSIEFYHDKGGLTTSKQEILDATRKNICGKVTRELVKGSIEVSPIPGYGAVEIGMHMFHNNQEKDQVPHPSKFVIIWRNKDGKWSITRVISLHS